jgi:Xaa-Pro aminopeptidase
MENSFEHQAKFATVNRNKLLKAVDSEADLIVIAGHSFLQASGDRTYPFQQDSNFFYLTSLLEPGLVLVLSRNEEYLIIPERDESRIAFDGEADMAGMSKLSGIKNIYPGTAGWSKLSKSLEQAKSAGVLMPAPDYIEPLDMFTNPSRQKLIDNLKKHNDQLQMVDLRSKMAGLRAVKSRYEIRMIQNAIRHTRKLFAIIERKKDRIGSENGLLAEITKYAVQNKLNFAYDPIIASGINAVTLHYIKNEAPIDREKPLLLDIGLSYYGYAADLTRTIGFKPDPRYEAVYKAVDEIQSYAISLLKPGVLLKEYEAEVRQFTGEKLRELGLISSISKENVRKYCPHSVSHFMGLDVHDPGEYGAPLEPGMVLTVEPGIYIKDESIGVRIEDNVLVTKTGCEVLTNKLPHDPYSLTMNTKS